LLEVKVINLLLLVAGRRRQVMAHINKSRRPFHLRDCPGEIVA
jgi:hypothetical protein